jgi:hypothetical protein
MGSSLRAPHEHDFLSSPDSRNWYQHLSPFLDCVVYDADELALHPFPVRHNVVRTTISALDDKCLRSREQCCSGIKHHCSSELEVGTVDDVVEAFADMQMDH